MTAITLNNDVEISIKVLYSREQILLNSKQNICRSPHIYIYIGKALAFTGIQDEIDRNVIVLGKATSGGRERDFNIITAQVKISQFPSKLISISPGLTDPD